MGGVHDRHGAGNSIRAEINIQDHGTFGETIKCGGSCGQICVSVVGGAAGLCRNLDRIGVITYDEGPGIEVTGRAVTKIYCFDDAGARDLAE